jgi:hypothetical protein
VGGGNLWGEVDHATLGGGGNYGIVTSFKFQAHPVKTVIGGPTLWPVEQTKEIYDPENLFSVNQNIKPG